MPDRWADGPKGTTCNGCGQCCEVIQLPLTRDEILADRTIPERVRQWYLNDLRPIPWRQARERAPWLAPPSTILPVDRGRQVAGYPSYYTCTLYDEETRRCGDWENRPEPCAGYPWYGRPSLDGMHLPPACEFRRDQGETPDPIEDWRPVQFGRSDT